MAQIPVVDVAAASGTPVAASASGDQYRNTGEHILLVFNSGTASANVTRLVQTQPQSPDVCADHVYSCPGSQMSMLPPLAIRRYNDNNGNVQVRYQGGTAPSLTVIVVHAPRAR